MVVVCLARICECLLCVTDDDNRFHSMNGGDGEWDAFNNNQLVPKNIKKNQLKI